MFENHNCDESGVLVVEGWQKGSRLDQLLHNFYSNISRTTFQDLISQGLVSVNGSTTKKSYKAEIGDEVLVHFNFSSIQENKLEPENIPLDIIYEDDHFLAINKPAGLVVHPAKGNWTGTFVNALLYYYQNLEKDDTLRPGIVHRLDKDTSGVLIAAKTKEAHEKLAILFHSRSIQKSYLAIVSGSPKDGMISAPLSRHPIRRKEMTVLPDGKESITEVELNKKGREISLVRLKPKTGRTHQLRVHMKHIGHPIVGDVLYGSEGLNMRFDIFRQMLHASNLTFKHPFTFKEVSIEAPIPQDMKKIMDRI